MDAVCVYWNKAGIFIGKTFLKTFYYFIYKLVQSQKSSINKRIKLIYFLIILPFFHVFCQSHTDQQFQESGMKVILQRHVNQEVETSGMQEVFAPKMFLFSSFFILEPW